MRWSITGVVLEADGKPASGPVHVQVYDLARKTWQAKTKGALDDKGRFNLRITLAAGADMLPAIRLCEASASGQPTRVLAEGGLVQIVSARSAHLSFGQVQRLGDDAVPRADRTKPFSEADDYLLAGAPRPPAARITATARMTLRNPQLGAFVQPQVVEKASASQLRMNADLSKRIELQDAELNQKQMQMVKLEQDHQKATQELRLAQNRIATLETQLKKKPAASAAKPDDARFTVATETMKLNLNEQIIRQAADYDIRALNLQQTINAKNLEIANHAERLQELSRVSREAMEEAAQAKAEAEQLKQQMNTQVGAGDLYANIGKQLQEAQSKLDSEAVPYRLGKVSLKLKTLVSGNQLTMPTLADLNNTGAAGIFTDVDLEYLPGTAQEAAEELVTVPDFTELTETLARRLARDLGLNLDAAYQSVTKPGQAIGEAIHQLPAKGTQVEPGDSIMVVFTQA